MAAALFLLNGFALDGRGYREARRIGLSVRPLGATGLKTPRPAGAATRETAGRDPGRLPVRAGSGIHIRTMKSGFLMLLAVASAGLFARPVAAQTNGIFADFATSMGSFTVRLDEVRAPRATANFIGLATGVQA